MLSEPVKVCDLEDVIVGELGAKYLYLPLQKNVCDRAYLIEGELIIGLITGVSAGGGDVVRQSMILEKVETVYPSHTRVVYSKHHVSENLSDTIFRLLNADANGEYFPPLSGTCVSSLHSIQAYETERFSRISDVHHQFVKDTKAVALLHKGGVYAVYVVGDDVLELSYTSPDVTIHFYPPKGTWEVWLTQEDGPKGDGSSLVAAFGAVYQHYSQEVREAQMKADSALALALTQA